MLKQGRIDPEYREPAINALGSSLEKEAFFLEYEMYDQLADLYSTERRFEELFDLWIKRGELLSALEVASDHGLLESTISIDRAMQILNYALAGSLTSSLPKVNGKCINAPWKPTCPVPSELQKQFEEWVNGEWIFAHWQDGEGRKKLMGMEDGTIKRILTFHVSQ